MVCFGTFGWDPRFHMAGPQAVCPSSSMGPGVWGGVTKVGGNIIPAAWSREGLRMRTLRAPKVVLSIYIFQLQFSREPGAKLPLRAERGAAGPRGRAWVSS